MERGHRRRRKGLVVVNTGDGKGKTSAAMGVLLRAWGRGMKVTMLQFIKHSTANFGEHRAARKIGVEMKPMGDGFTWLSKNMDSTKRLALELWRECKEKILSGGYDIVILDEFTYPLHYGWIPVEDALETLRSRPPDLHVIITGRHAPQELIEFADLVTEMREIKHPYRKGIKAQLAWISTDRNSPKIQAQRRQCLTSSIEAALRSTREPLRAY